MKYEVTTVDAYLEAIDQDKKEQLEQIIGLIKKIAPAVQEVYKHHMPCYELGEMLFAVAAQKEHLALYVTEIDIVEKYKTELGKASIGKSCIRFKNIQQLNLSGVEKILEQAYQKRLQ
jgi:uncharacterized protein YdhG (YjbR/CyaY superfamily)